MTVMTERYPNLVLVPDASGTGVALQVSDARDHQLAVNFDWTDSFEVRDGVNRQRDKRQLGAMDVRPADGTLAAGETRIFVSLMKSTLVPTAIAEVIMSTNMAWPEGAERPLDGQGVVRGVLELDGRTVPYSLHIAQGLSIDGLRRTVHTGAVNERSAYGDAAPGSFEFDDISKVYGALVRAVQTVQR